jgi:hypothetical protein
MFLTEVVEDIRMCLRHSKRLVDSSARRCVCLKTSFLSMTLAHMQLGNGSQVAVGYRTVVCLPLGPFIVSRNDIVEECSVLVCRQVFRKRCVFQIVQIVDYIRKLLMTSHQFRSSIQRHLVLVKNGLSSSTEMYISSWSLFVASTFHPFAEVVQGGCGILNCTPDPRVSLGSTRKSSLHGSDTE